MLKKTNKIILFSKDPMPTNEKFYKKMGKELNMEIEKDNPISGNNSHKIIIDGVPINNPNYFSLKSEKYFLNVQGNRLEFQMSDTLKSEYYDLEDFQNQFKIIINNLTSIFAVITRVGYIYNYLDEKTQSLDEELNIGFLKNSNEVNIQFNKKLDMFDYQFNNNVTISTHLKKINGLFISQDFNFIVNPNYNLDLNIINKVFEHLKSEYYTENFKDKILK